MQFQQAQCAKFPETLFCKALASSQKTLYKEFEGKICGQAAISADYEKYVVDFAGFKEGTCADQGFSHADGSKTLNVPVVGEIDLALYDNVLALEGDEEVTLYQITGAECGQSTLPKKYESYAQDFDKELKEGLCADHGYTVPDGSKDIKVPFIGTIHTAEFKKSAERAAADQVTLFEIEKGLCGQASLDKAYEKYAEKFANLKEGTCAAQGYTVDDGSKDLKVPFIGDIKVALYTKKNTLGKSADSLVDLWQVKGFECGQIQLAKKYEQYVEKVDKDLAEGTCAAQGYTVKQGVKDINVPLIGDIEVSVFRKSSLKADADAISLYQVEYGVCAQATVEKKFEGLIEKMDAKLQEGTCASAGYTKDDGEKDYKLPFVGDIKFALYTKAKNVQMMI